MKDMYHISIFDRAALDSVRQRLGDDLLFADFMYRDTLAFIGRHEALWTWLPAMIFCAAGVYAMALILVTIVAPVRRMRLFSNRRVAILRW